MYSPASLFVEAIISATRTGGVGSGFGAMQQITR
jgi:hypothetical protein